MFSANPSIYAMSEERLHANNELEFRTLVDQAVSEVKLWNEEKGYSLDDVDDAEIDLLILSPEERQQRETYWELVLQRTHGISRQPKEQSSEHGEGRKRARNLKLLEEEQHKKIDFSSLLLDDNMGDDSLFSETEAETINRFTLGFGPSLLTGEDESDTLFSPQVKLSVSKKLAFSDDNQSDLFSPSDSEAPKRQRTNVSLKTGKGPLVSLQPNHPLNQLSDQLMESEADLDPFSDAIPSRSSRRR